VRQIGYWQELGQCCLVILLFLCPTTWFRTWRWSQRAYSKLV